MAENAKPDAKWVMTHAFVFSNYHEIRQIR
jgi:hypothetical protein